MWTGRLTYAIFISFLLSAQAHSQEPAKKDASAEATLSITFEGKTVDDYVAVVKKQARSSNVSANIVVDKGVGKIEVEKVDLPRVTIRNALEWITKTAEGRKQSLLVQSVRSGRDANEVFVLTASALPRTPPPAECLTKLYPVPKEGEGRKDPEVVAKAMQEQLQKRCLEPKTTAAYSAEHGVITVTGTRADIQLTDQVVDAMTRSQPMITTTMRALQGDVDKLKGELADVKKEVADLKKKIEK